MVRRRRRDNGRVCLSRTISPRSWMPLEMLLRPEGYRLDRAESASPAHRVSRERELRCRPDGHELPRPGGVQEGIDLLAEIRGFGLRVPIIVMTAWANIDLAVEAMKRGARDFIQKPWDNARLITVLRNQIDLHRAHRRTELLEAENSLLRAQNLPEFIAAAPAMRPVLELMARIGPSGANVLITGEHGSGKEVVACHSTCTLPALITQPGSGEHRSLAGRDIRKRDLRARERCFHRRSHGPHRPIRTCRSRYTFPR